MWHWKSMNRVCVLSLVQFKKRFWCTLQAWAIVQYQSDRKYCRDSSGTLLFRCQNPFCLAYKRDGQYGSFIEIAFISLLIKHTLTRHYSKILFWISNMKPSDLNNAHLKWKFTASQIVQNRQKEENGEGERARNSDLCSFVTYDWL